MGRINLRSKVLAVAAGVAAVVTFVAACGSDNGSGPEGCAGAACFGGSPESSTKDGSSSDDRSTPTDGGGDADADSSIPFVCMSDGGDAGTLDPTFGDGGLVWIGDPGSGAYSIAVQSDGKILVGGYSGASKPALARLHPSGALDPAFGSGGIAETTLGFGGIIRAIVPLADGRILVAGSAYPSASSVDFAVIRYLSNGTPDPAFGDGGAVATNAGLSESEGVAATSLPDGHVLVAGSTMVYQDPSTSDYALARYAADGALDVAFGSSGKVTTDVRGTRDGLGGVLPLSGGAILAAGSSARQTGSCAAGCTSDIALIKYSASGSLDTAFGDGGTVLARDPGGQSLGAIRVVLDSAGAIVLGGQRSNSQFAVIRLTATGAFDNTFGTAGVVTTDFGGTFAAAQGGVHVQPDGKIVATGTAIMSAAPNDAAIVVARYMHNGTLDPGFGSGGKVITSLAPNANAQGLASNFDGCSILVAGTWYSNAINNTRMGIARYVP